MQSEEGYKQKVWSVLQKIKRYYIQNNNELPIQYEIHLFPINNNYLSSQEECDILKNLAESLSIQIYQRQIKNNLCIVIYLCVIQPKFNEINRKFGYYQKINDYNNRNQKSEEIEKFRPNNQNQYNLCFPTYYLNQEIKRFEILLKHFMKAGAICYKDYRYLIIINKMMRKLILESVRDEKRNRFSRKYYPKNNLNRNKETKFRKNNSPKEMMINNENVDQKNINIKQPLPITGKIEVSGLSEGLKALRAKEALIAGPKFPFKIPAGTHWNNVIIKFLNDEEIEIHVKKLKHITNYKEMEMIGKGKIPTPSEQWLFLKVLAQYQGEITIKDPEAKDKYKKQKQALTETLRNYFSIDYDPFYPYKSCPEKGGNSYKIKILLIPPIKKEIPQEENEVDNDPLGIQEYLNSNIVAK